MDSQHWSHFLSNGSKQLFKDESLLPLGQSMSLCDASLFGSNRSMGVLNEVNQKGSLDASRPPRRNLTEAFEELYVEPNDVTSPATKEQVSTDSSKKSEVSPTSVADIVVTTSDSESRDTPDTASKAHVASEVPCEQQDILSTTTDEIPHFQLHPSLQRDLSQALVNRVSFYGVIHDINKEADFMATSDTSSFARSCGDDPEDEEFSPLVVAVAGKPSRPAPSSSMMNAAVIDEEKWLLAVIESRGQDEARSVAACPPTFLQAMGEREYENPLSSMETSRTQLWKPSRSWWEAKSGKNPWIEPTSHNKRWRYLWPLIHYHKFLAKCIKKLKRNGVDVKTAVSPVAVFLREEVCAVSDHLALVSLFTSEEWMDCLVHFNGWINHSPAEEQRLRTLVSRLNLRPIAEPGDVDSSLLRSQVDEHFLRAMASAREQMTNGGIQQERANMHKNSSEKYARKIPPSGRSKIPLHPHRANPPSYPTPTNNKIASGAAESVHGTGGDGQPPYGYHGQWWPNGWPQYAYCDESSVQSGLSGDSYLQQYSEYGMFPTPAGYYPQDRSEYYYGQASGYPPHPGMTPEGWMPHPSGDPHSAYTAEASPGPGYMHPPGTPSSHSSPHQNYNPYQFSPTHMQPAGNYGVDNRHTPARTPQKSPYSQGGVPSSPYWGHLDQSTLAMTGLVTPHGKLPETPQRAGRQQESADQDEQFGDPDTPEKDKTPEDYAASAQPLLINNWSQYYHHGSLYGAREGYVPPSPATQFMMSPQASSQAAAYYAHNYNGGAYRFSPHRHGSRQHYEPRPSLSLSMSPQVEKTGMESSADVTPPPVVRKVTENGRDSPVTAATVETAAESESIVES